MKFFDSGGELTIQMFEGLRSVKLNQMNAADGK